MCACVRVRACVHACVLLVCVYVCVHVHMCVHVAERACACVPAGTCPDGYSYMVASRSGDDNTAGLCLPNPNYDIFAKSFALSVCWRWACVPPSFTGGCAEGQGCGGGGWVYGWAGVLRGQGRSMSVWEGGAQGEARRWQRSDWPSWLAAAGV